MVIVNGRVKGDEMGAFTCHISQGSSVVDYFIASSSLMAAVVSMTVETRRLESDHCPLTLMMQLQAEKMQCAADSSEAHRREPDVHLEKIKYKADKVDSYREALSHLLYPVFSSHNRDCCLATSLQACLAQAAIAIFGRRGSHACPKPEQKWYDEECKAARALLKHLTPGTAEHVTKGKAYKALLRRKRRAWQRHAQQSLCELAYRKPQAFWKQYKRKAPERNDIPCQEWKEAFEALYKASETTPMPAPQPQADISTVNRIQAESPCPSPSPHDTTSQLPDAPFDFLNADITHEEVRVALKRLKREQSQVCGIWCIFAGLMVSWNASCTDAATGCLF